MNNSEELKPITFVDAKRSYYSDDRYVQDLLLRAMSQGITDPNDLMKVAGLSKVADVYRSLNKLAIRKEYHEALVRNKVDLDYIVGSLRAIIDTSGSDKVKLGAVQTFLKSLGLEKYDAHEEGGKGWEELIVEARENKRFEKENQQKVAAEGEFREYEVKIPEMPKEEIKESEKEKTFGENLFKD